MRINPESLRNNKAGAIFTGTRGQYNTSSKRLCHPPLRASTHKWWKAIGFILKWKVFSHPPWTDWYLCSVCPQFQRSISESSLVAMDFSGQESRVIENPSEALSVAVEEGLSWRVSSLQTNAHNVFPRVTLNWDSCLLQRKSCHRLSTHGSPSTSQSLASSIGRTDVCRFHSSARCWRVSSVKSSLSLFSRPPRESVMVSRQNVSRRCAAPHHSAGSYRRVDTFHPIWLNTKSTSHVHRADTPQWAIMHWNVWWCQFCVYIFRRSHHDVAISLPWFQSVSSEGQPEQPKDVRPVAVPHAENQTLSDRTCEFSHPCSTTPAALGSPDPLCLPACRWMTKGRCSSVWTMATHASRTWSSWWSFTSSTVGCCPANSNTTAPGSPCEPRAPRDPSLDEHSLCICALNNTNRQNNTTAWLKPLLR